MIPKANHTRVEKRENCREEQDELQDLLYEFEHDNSIYYSYCITIQVYVSYCSFHGLTMVERQGSLRGQGRKHEQEQKQCLCG